MCVFPADQQHSQHGQCRDTSSGGSIKSMVVLRVICGHGPYKETKDIWGHFATNGIWGQFTGLLPHSPVFCGLSCSHPACWPWHITRYESFSTGDHELVQQVCSVRSRIPSQDCVNCVNSKLFFWLHLSKYRIAITTVLFWQVNESVLLVLQASFEHKWEWFRCSKEEKASFNN